MRETPIPFRGQGYASLPRFRAEIGPFVGIASGVDRRGRRRRILGEPGGRCGRAPSTSGCGSGTASTPCSAIPATAWSSSRAASCCSPAPRAAAGPTARPTRSSRSSFRACPRAPRCPSGCALPFWLIPGDLLLAAPVLALREPEAAREDGDRRRRRRPDPVADEALDAGRLAPVRGGARGRPSTCSDTWAGRTPSSRSRGRSPDGAPIFEPVAFRSIEWNFPILELRPAARVRHPLQLFHARPVRRRLRHARSTRSRSSRGSRCRR